VAQKTLVEEVLLQEIRELHKGLVGTDLLMDSEHLPMDSKHLPMGNKHLPMGSKQLLMGGNHRHTDSGSPLMNIALI